MPADGTCGDGPFVSVPLFIPAEKHGDRHKRTVPMSLPMSLKKCGNRILAVVVVLLLAAVLAACSGSEITSGPKGATFKLKNLEKGDLLETRAKFSFDDGLLKVDLESGTVDVEIVTIIPDEGDDDLYTELSTIYTGQGLKNGDEVEISDLRAEVVMRVTGESKGGTVTLSPKK